MQVNSRRKPDWLKTGLKRDENYYRTAKLLKQNRMNTICSSGNCPNIAECWNSGTATFMILGDVCTRNCRFCNTKTGKPLPIDTDEPSRVARTVNLMHLKHCVITSVDRDDLPDCGLSAWVNTINEIRSLNPDVSIEVLIPDFDGDLALLTKLLETKPDVVGHNLETVERLTSGIRSKASYKTSLCVLKKISEYGLMAKSGIMLGLGETESEIYKTMDDLLSVGCKNLTIGQYLQPTQSHIPVNKYYEPDFFEKLRHIAIQKGFVFAECGPLVRSSYHAEKQFCK